MTTLNPVHSQVSEQYTAALERAQTRAGGGCCGGPVPCGAAAATAGYDPAAPELADAAAASFGCGNPLAFAEVQAGQTVVDLGSGAGYDLLLAAERVGPEGRVIGVDMTDAMIEAARANAARAGAWQVQVRKGLIEALPVADCQADWIISNCVINLSPEKDKVFEEIARVLKPGGQFRVSDVVASELPGWVREDALAYAACVAGAIDEAAYLDGLRAAGLVDLEVVSRYVYTAEQVRAIVDTDFAAAGLDGTPWEARLGELEGKVASVTVRGRKPRAGGCC
jgi:ubiquinone/menaquinone biosynthesis C-methylase UbiE